MSGEATGSRFAALMTLTGQLGPSRSDFVHGDPPRSALSPASSAAAEFYSHTAPNDLSRRHTVARNRVRSEGIRYINTIRPHEARYSRAITLNRPRT